MNIRKVKERFFLGGREEGGGMFKELYHNYLIFSTAHLYG